jgi:hypothetical protein
VRAVLEPVVGSSAVAGLLTAGLGNFARGTLAAAQVNGHPALVLRRDGEVDTVLALRIDDGLVTGLYAVRNPEKLSRLDEETPLRR